MFVHFYILVPILAFLAGVLNGVGGSGGVVLMVSLIMMGFPPVSATGINKATALFGASGALINFLKRVMYFQKYRIH